MSAFVFVAVFGMAAATAFYVMAGTNNNKKGGKRR